MISSVPKFQTHWLQQTWDKKNKSKCRSKIFSVSIQNTFDNLEKNNANAKIECNNRENRASSYRKQKEKHCTKEKIIIRT